MKLLHTPKFIADESPSSILIRTSEQNGWKLLGYFLSSIGFRKCDKGAVLSWLVDNNKWNAFVMSFNADHLADRGIPYHKQKSYNLSPINVRGHFTRLPYIRQKFSALCPECVDENGYLDYRWDLKLITACPKHSRLLIEECSKCGEKIQHYRSKLNQCRCGHYFINNPVTAVDTQETEYIYKFLKSGEHNQTQLTESIFNALMAMTGENQSLEMQHQYAIDAFQLATSGTQSPAFKRLLKFLKHHAELGLHPRLCLWPLLTMKGSLAHDICSRLLSTIKLDTQAKTISTCKKQLVTEMRTQQAARTLACSVHIVKKLIEQGWLKRGESNFFVTIEPINQLLWAFSQESTAKNSNSAFEEVGYLLKHPKFKLSVSDILKAVDSQVISLKPMRLDKGILSSKITEPVKTTPDTKGYIALLNLAEKTQIPYESLRKLIKLGVFNPVKIKDTSNATFLKPQQVERFFHSYVFSTQLAKDFGLSGQAIAARLRRAGVRPEGKPFTDRGITNLYRKSKLAALNLNELMKE
ncbi:TniQ family protein [Kangiella shandongensis]|uniref:TniQ family protein n=1 Tax=Kangiella shandongensis TaxID=2763258 RepID=UPI001CBA8C35|nr:TniQ family protein [Kangiella shandongensis]